MKSNLRGPVLLLCLAALLFSGTGEAADGMGVNDFARRYGFKLTSAPGSCDIRLSATGCNLRFSPGLSFVNINNHAAELSRPPKMLRGELWIPGEVVRLLPASLTRRPSVRIEGTVILDPGHGGKDSGAVGYGVKEKDVVLDVAKRTGRILASRGATVVYTRQTDHFISLSGRSDIANQTPVAIFISIHANSTQNARQTTSGVETFVLARKISENYRVKKASSKFDLRENGRVMDAASKSKVIAGMSKEAREESSRLASRVQTSLVKELGEIDRKVKQKNLAVLRDTYFGPAILTEIGFLSHPNTARKMRSTDYREKIAKAIAEGISAFLKRQ